MLWVTSEDHISGQQTNLCPHVDQLFAILFNRSKVSELQRLSEGDDWLVRVRVVHTFDGHFLTFTWVVARRGDAYYLTGLPVDRLSESDLSAPSLNCRIKQRPGRITLNSVHIECAVPHSDDFVAVDW